MKNEHDETLKKVQSALMQMHRYLMNSLKTDRENQMGRSIPATEWFHLMVSDPEFKWLRTASGLMSDIDALMDNYTVSENELKLIRQELESLFLVPNENPNEFQSIYSEIAKRNSDVMLYHAHLKQMIQSLPSGGSPVADTSEVRKAWHQKPQKHHS
ncbi:MAG: hypothetical protein ACAH59_13825 [Pseudobdellovibrionaceae bacterium]